MEYITDISINEAVVHILDNNADEVVLNQFTLKLDEELYFYLEKHIKKALRDEELKYAFFNGERNLVKEISQEYLNGAADFLETSKELARQLFVLMRSKGNIPSCDLVVVSFSTEFGPMLGVLKMDYIKNYIHAIDFLEDRIGINIVPQYTGLPSNSQRIQKCAFIKKIQEDNEYDLLLLDKKAKTDKNEEYGANYFVMNYLGSYVVDNDRDITKLFVKAAEKWTRETYKENAVKQEIMRTGLKKQLKEVEEVDIEKVSEEILGDNKEEKEKFIKYIKEQGVDEKIQIDKNWLEKKFKRVRLKVDKDVDIYLDEETYHDNSRFVIQRNGDGTINMTIRGISNYLEK
ncbi:nucleoid-associated protein [Clostridium sp. DL1XJH146]